MKHISAATFLAVLSTIARLTGAQDCPTGTHLTNGACCPLGTTFYTSPTGGHEACCADGMTYHHNAAGNAGTCCPAGYVYDETTNDCYKRQVAGGSQGPVKPVQKPIVSPPDDRCAGCCGSSDGQGQTPGGSVNTPGTTPGGTPNVPVAPVPGEGNNPGGGITTPGLPNQPRPVNPQSSVGSCGCATGTPCSTDDELGLQYGHCYNLIDTNGLPLGRDTGGTYQSGGDVQNLIFRVCKSTDDCSGELGKHVPQHTGKFFLLDQQGWTNWKGPAWFGNNWPHMQVERARNAAEFIGEGVCMYGSPAICLRDGAKERGLIAPCPLGWDSARAHIGYTNNPNTCKAYRFIPTKCLSSMAAEKN